MRPFGSFFRIAALLVGCAWVTNFVLRADEATLKVTFGGKTLSCSLAEIAALPHQEVTAYDFHEKKSHLYSGIPVRDFLAKAGVEFGEKLRGKSLRLAVLAHCADHYDIVFALAEFDPAFNARTILLVDRQDGQSVPPGQGPLRLVIPGDQRPARWARMVTSLEVTGVGSSTLPP